MSTMRRALPDAMRRGWCPGLARPMPTGDGLLARVHPPFGHLTIPQLRAVADAAQRFGNGHVDVTARANLQIRGVTPATGGDLSAFLDDRGLGDLRRDGGPQRLTLTSPLAGLDPHAPIDVIALAAAIEAGGRTIAGLPAKTLVALDGPGLREPGADLELSFACGCVRIAMAGDAGGDLVVGPKHAADAVTAILHAFAATGRRRIRDVAPDERARLRSAIGTLRDAGEHLRDVAAASRSLAPGLATLGPHTIVVVEAPFGRCTADALNRLAASAEAIERCEIRLTPSRGFALVGGNGAAAGRACDALAAAGFIVRDGDPRRAVAACPGAPACGSGTTPVPEHAGRLAEAFAPFAARGLTAHVSGCAKGCAHPGPADLTLVAEAGAYRVALGGDPAAAIGSRLTFETALERVRRADPAQPLAGAFRDFTLIDSRT